MSGSEAAGSAPAAAAAAAAAVVVLTREQRHANYVRLLGMDLTVPVPPPADIQESFKKIWAMLITKYNGWVGPEMQKKHNLKRIVIQNYMPFAIWVLKLRRHNHITENAKRVLINFVRHVRAEAFAAAMAGAQALLAEGAGSPGSGSGSSGGSSSGGSSSGGGRSSSSSSSGGGKNRNKTRRQRGGVSVPMSAPMSGLTSAPMASAPTSTRKSATAKQEPRLKRLEKNLDYAMMRMFAGKDERLVKDAIIELFNTEKRLAFRESDLDNLMETN